MASSKKLVVDLSEALYNQFNETLKKDCKKSSEFIIEAIILYIEEKKRLNNIQQMKKGYEEMGKLNLEISEFGLDTDVKELLEYEVKLSESDLLNDDSSKKRRYILC